MVSFNLERAKRAYDTAKTVFDYAALATLSVGAMASISSYASSVHMKQIEADNAYRLEKLRQEHKTGRHTMTLENERRKFNADQLNKYGQNAGGIAPNPPIVPKPLPPAITPPLPPVTPPANMPAYPEAPSAIEKSKSWFKK